MPGERLTIDAGGFGVVLAVADDGALHQLAFGADLSAATTEVPVGLHPLAYPTFGDEITREPALRVTHADGATSTRLRHRASTQAAHAHGVEHRIELVDRVAPLAVTLCYRTWPAHGVLEQWVEVVNEGDRPCTVHQASSSAPSFTGAAPHLTHWGGGWAGEWTETTERLTMGTKTVASAGGVRPSLHLEPVVLLAPEGRATETTGTVALATTVWGGDTRIDAEVARHGQLRLVVGPQHRGAERTLEPGERTSSPSVLWAWSEAGVGPTSRAMHRFVRDHVVRDGRRIRATVANTWEAVFFGLDPEGLARQVDHAAALGAELFLLDDGWFGPTHPRNDDTSSLGDWGVDRTKLPDGLQPLIDHTLAAGLRFGLWVEPEMVNPRSELYATHPDWVIGEPGRDRREERNQLVLDLTRPEVFAFCLEVVDGTLRDHPGISYLKWDANRDITEPGSPSLPADRQAHLPFDRVHATWALMAEVHRRHPDVELMLCASGGGRTDLGTLRHFHEHWTSDNTDPVDRVRIQWGASHLLPASVVAAHVTRWGAKPFAFACAVALSGRFGLDLDLPGLSDLERTQAAEAVAVHHRIRAIVQQGDLHRLVSPVDGDRAALAVHDPDSGRIVVFAYLLGDGPERALAIEVPGVDRGRPYRVEDLTPGRSGSSSTAAGSELADGLLAWPAGPAPAASVWLLSPEG